ncbi:MAG TPA: ABC transporter permease [Gemmatimonadaceae bacterium]|nr:ABC transporter permease [Gemmatimonadaceae bacterium]
MRRVFRLPFTRGRMDEALDDELRFHIEERIREFEARGLSRTQAEAEVRRRFGNYDAYRSETRHIDETIMRDQHQLEVIDTIRRETRHAAATLRRSPGFTLIALVTLALGLGAATTIFTLLDRVVLRPLPYPDADRLVHIGTLWPGVRADAEFAISRGQFFYFKQHSAALANIGLYDTDMMPISGDAGFPAERVPTIYASASLFDVLGIAPERGRLFRAEEGISRDPAVALISHGYWQRRFGADPNVVGKRLYFDKQSSVEIIGVLPAGAGLPDFKGDIWIPNWLDPAAEPQNNHTHSAIGLAKPGVSIEAVQSDLERLQTQFEQQWPRVYPPSFKQRTGFALHVNWLRQQVVGDKVTRALWILFSAVAVVLLIAAANVANLFLVRIDARRRETALRTALGANRGHLAAHFLTESLLLTIVAAGAAAFVSYALLHVVLALAPQELPRLEEISLDWRGVAFCFAAALAAGVVFGVIPVATRSMDLSLLREGGRGLTTSRAHNLARRTLVVAQVALAVVLFAGAALMVKSYAHLRDVRMGFDPSGVSVMTLALPYNSYTTYQRTSAFWQQLEDRVAALPGVEAVGATETLPLTGESGCTAVVTDFVNDTARTGGCVPTVPVTPGYFEAMHIRVRGTAPDWSLTQSGIGPVVVSQAIADQLFPGTDPIGHGIKINNDAFQFFRIVGVAEDVRANGLQKPPVNIVYFPLVPPAGTRFWNAGYGMALVVRAPSMDANRAGALVRRIASEMDRQVPVDEVRPMEFIVSRSLAQTSFTMMLLLISAGIALVLSAVGLYGVISYIVSHRRSEIGIRMALGARVIEVTSMVLRQSLMLGVVGVGVGVALALAGTKVLESLLFEVRANDPVVLVITGATLLIVAAVASVGPARRAAHVDPVEALRG